MIHDRSSLFQKISPPIVNTKKADKTSPAIEQSEEDLSAKDRADIALEKLQEKDPAAPKTQRKDTTAILGTMALLGLTGLGFFQGTAAQAAPPPAPVEAVVESQHDYGEVTSADIITTLETSPQMHVAGRQGLLLGAGKILKFDQYPGLHREHLAEQLPGAPNFRQVEGTNVFGVAQPTVDGIRAVLDRTGAKDKPVVWTNMREEPVVYINGRSFSLREEAHPFENSADFKGVSSETVHKTEQQLKQEILNEAKANGGRILLHGESSDGEVTSEWVSITPDSVKTTQEVYDGFRAEGYQVDFARVPVTDEKTPETKDLQALVRRLTGAPEDASFIFNCHAGRGRTTTAMVATQLLQRAQNPDAEAIPFQKIEAVREDIKEQGHYEQGNYRLILSLIRSLDSGAQAKAETDQILDQTEHIQNLRKDINKYRERSLTTENAGKAQLAESKGQDYLHRYHTLISFNQYVKDQAPKGFEQTFEQWLEARPEVGETIQTIELVMNESLGDSRAGFA